MMAAERSEVAHNFSFSGKAKFAFQKSSFQPQRQQFQPQKRVFHPREYGNPNTVPMEIGNTQQYNRNTPSSSA
jgi:hypothetical protein